jgi:hypothetical protein
MGTITGVSTVMAMGTSTDTASFMTTTTAKTARGITTTIPQDRSRHRITAART